MYLDLLLKFFETEMAIAVEICTKLDFAKGKSKDNL